VFSEISVGLIFPDDASHRRCVRIVVERRLEHVEDRAMVCTRWNRSCWHHVKGREAFRSLLHEPNAAGNLKALLSAANLAGQCYALLVLYVLHDAAYQENVVRYKSSDARVKTVGGCMITEQPVSSIVSNIAAGRYDSVLNAPIH
jgi:hypothetical protein